MSKAIRFNAIVNSVRTRRDNSLSLSVETPELTNEETLVMLRIKGINLDCTLKPLEAAEKEVVLVKAKTDTKSPSQRIRAVLYLIWQKLAEQNGTDKVEPFETYYARRCEKIITWLKKDLEDE